MYEEEQYDEEASDEQYSNEEVLSKEDVNEKWYRHVEVMTTIRIHHYTFLVPNVDSTIISHPY